MGVARSNVHHRTTRTADWTDGRTAARLDPQSDEVVVASIRREIAELTSYGYQRTAALVNRARGACGQPPVNHKRIYRLMKQHRLLLSKAPKRHVSSRPHDGKVAVTESDTRWCSDGFEIARDNGQELLIRVRLCGGKTTLPFPLLFIYTPNIGHTPAEQSVDARWRP